MQDAYLIAYSMSYTGDSTSYYIWYEDAQGRNRFDSAEDKLAAFWTEADAMQQIITRGMRYKDTVNFDAERLDYWLFTGSRSQIYVDDQLDTEFLLDFWNLFDDAAYSLGIKLPEPNGADACYEKLFRSQDAASLVSDPAALNPALSEDEIAIIRSVLQTGFDLIQRHTEMIQPEDQNENI